MGAYLHNFIILILFPAGSVFVTKPTDYLMDSSIHHPPIPAATAYLASLNPKWGRTKSTRNFLGKVPKELFVLQYIQILFYHLPHIQQCSSSVHVHTYTYPVDPHLKAPGENLKLFRQLRIPFCPVAARVFQ